MGKKIELSKRTEKILAFSFIGIFLLGGMTMCYFFYVKYLFINSGVQKNWEKVPCKIVSLNVESKSTRRNNKKRGPGRKRTSSSYYYVTEYKYSYENNDYTSNVYNKQQWFTVKSSNKLNVRAAEIKKQKPTECYVNPKNPEEAVLDPSIIPGSEVLLWVGLGFVGVSLLCVFDYNRRSRKKLNEYNESDGEVL